MFLVFFFTLSLRSGVIDRLRFMSVFLNQGGREIKLKYNTFINIMTRMLSNVKKIYSLKKKIQYHLSTYSVFRRRNTVLIVCNTD